MVHNIKSLQPGELILVRNKGTIMDINETIKKKLGGGVSCRINRMDSSFFHVLIIYL